MTRRWVHRPAPRALSRRGRSTVAHPPFPPAPVNGYLIDVLSPVNGATGRNRRPVVTVLPTSDLAAPVDVQVEWRQTIPYPTNDGAWLPVPTQESAYLAVPSGFPLDVSPPNDLGYTSWFYRARAGSVTTGLWSAWTATARYLDVTPIVGSIAWYLEMNVGVEATKGGTLAYLDLNVGAAVVEELGVVAYTEMNVGVLPRWRQTTSYFEMNVYPPTGKYTTARYVDVNVVTTRPVPHIWWIRPEQGREGYVFNIYGHGFGQFENQYDGVVHLGDLICPVIRWERVTAIDPPDSIVRAVDPDHDVMKPEHGWIVVVVPTDAVSGMVDVTLEGGA